MNALIALNKANAKQLQLAVRNSGLSVHTREVREATVSRNPSSSQLDELRSVLAKHGFTALSMNDPSFIIPIKTAVPTIHEADPDSVQALATAYAVKFIRHFDRECSEEECVVKYEVYRKHKEAGHTHFESLQVAKLTGQ